MSNVVAAYRLKVASLYNPVTLLEAKQQLNIAEAFTQDDTLITAYIKAATTYYFNRTNRALIQSTWELAINNWSCFEGLKVELPVGPLLSVVSVKYYDTSNVLQTLSSTEYIVDTRPGLGVVWFNGTLPSIYARHDAIIVEFIVGATSTVGSVEAVQQAAVDELDKHIIKILLTDFYLYRGEIVPLQNISSTRTVDILLSERRLFRTWY